MNETLEGGAGKHAVPEATRAFAAIVRDITLVFKMDYRDATFQKWRDVAKTALEIYLGPMHPLTLEFLAIKWRGSDGPAPAADQQVGPDDELLYSAGLETAKDILDRAYAEAKAREDAAAKVVAGMAKPETEAKPKGESRPVSEPAAEPPKEPGPLRIIRSGDGRESVRKAPPVADSEPGGNTPGPVKIITRGGLGSDTLEAVISSNDDPEEKSLLVRLKEELDEPEPEWVDVKALMHEIYSLSPSLAQRLLPIILKR